MLRSLADEELVAQLQGGHHDALSVIVDRYQRLVWSVARRIVRDEAEAEDVTQTVFLEFFQKVGLFDPARGTLKGWLLQLAYTRGINRRYHLQRRQFYRRVEVDEKIAEVSPSAVSPFRLDEGEIRRLVHEILDRLNANQRTAIQSIALEGLTFEELATQMGETVSNAKHHYYRGMMKLRECLSESESRKERAQDARA